MNKIEGIFHILAGGMCAGIIIAVCELLYNAKVDAVKSHREVKQSLTDKTIFYLHATANRLIISGFRLIISGFRL